MKRPERPDLTHPMVKEQYIADLERAIDGLEQVIADLMGAQLTVEAGNVRLHSVCAAAAHMTNRVWCKAHGDESQPLWSEAPGWQRDSAIKGVAGALAGNTPEQSHQGWLAVKAAEGWKWGPVKDVEAKEHPCFVPYAALPDTQRAKDQLYLDTVREVAAALGLAESEPVARAPTS